MEQHEIDDMMSNLQDYLERQNINTSRFFRCLNPQHIDSNASMKYFDDCKVYCFGCGCSYDLVGVIGAVEGLDRKEAFEHVKEIGQCHATQRWYWEDHAQDELYSEDLY